MFVVLSALTTTIVCHIGNRNRQNWPSAWCINIGIVVGIHIPSLWRKLCRSVLNVWLVQAQDAFLVLIPMATAAVIAKLA